MRLFHILVLCLCLLLSGCRPPAEPTLPPTESTSPPTEPVTAAAEHEPEPGTPVAILTQRPPIKRPDGTLESVNFRFVMPVAEQPNDRQMLVRHIRELIWLVPRGGAGIDSLEAQLLPESELPLVLDSNLISPEAVPEDLPGQDSRNKSPYTWVRLQCEPFPPTPGRNEVPRRDVMVWVDPINPEDAAFAIQDYDDPLSWHVTPMCAYGQWLARELDLFYRMTLAM